MFASNMKLASLMLLSVVIFDTVRPGVAVCQNLIRSGLTSQERDSILHAHNKLRQIVAMGQVSGQPAASDMQEMEWDSELAAKAQNWADRCIYEHDHNDQRDVRRFPVGQNIATTWNSHPTAFGASPDFMSQIRAWFDEVSIYYMGNGYSEATGHYSQLVWGETNKVGCGYSHWYDRSQGYTKFYVCNYGPGGNVIGYDPYTKGYPDCKSHGMSSSSKYPGLCGKGSYQNSLNSIFSNSNNAVFSNRNTAVYSTNNARTSYDFSYFKF
ncbi:venom allergen 5-like [Ctenocephalides felis]|uniref:venom allergen 5-like n=1 Tax=Ctenocephalides felis TaxID=7515 RepID=UPI000E6E1673|nr:venom allergen 5-like [Ctenocephalides felis]